MLVPASKGGEVATQMFGLVAPGLSQWREVAVAAEVYTMVVHEISCHGSAHTTAKCGR